tara:strand:+ start:235 stop:522 length:288 start_codon:yes stop_codon:yes gene_type:complete
VHNHRRERWDRVRNGFGDGETELQGHLRRPGWEEDGTRFDENAGRHINVIIIIIVVVVIIIKDRDRRDGFERPEIDRVFREDVHGLGGRVGRFDK